MPTDLCLCAEIQHIQIKTKIAVLMHSHEEQKSTNTVRLLKLAIPETEIAVFGRRDQIGSFEIPPNVTPFVLFPEPSAPLLDEALISTLKHPVMLVVPDGTWQQAKKLIHRRENLFGVPRIRIARTEPSAYLLRRTQRAGGLCTLEAIAEALATLEGKKVKTELLRLLDIMVTRTMLRRGQE